MKENGIEKKGEKGNHAIGHLFDNMLSHTHLGSLAEVWQHVSRHCPEASVAQKKKTRDRLCLLIL